MRTNTAYLPSHGAVLIAAALLLGLSPGGIFAQGDAKDREIAQLKALVEAQSRQIEKLTQKQINIQEQVLKALRDREAMIALLELEKKTLKIEAVQQAALAKAAKVQAEQLLEQVRLLEARLARLAGEKESDNPRGGGDHNPPPVTVQGKIEKIDGDLMQINLGTDQGIAKNHTLEIYRLAPEAKYLGRLRIVDASTTQAVGRLIAPANAARPALKIGDQVASQLLPRAEPKK